MDAGPVPAAASAPEGQRFSTLNKARIRASGEPLAVLDVGSSKIVCLIGRFDEAGRLAVLGMGQHVAAGIEAGLIVDMEDAAHAIGRAVHAAETQAGLRVDKVTVNINDAYTRAQKVDFTLAIGGRRITPDLLRRAFSRSPTLQQLAQYEIIHRLPLGYTLDETPNIVDPLDMVGQQLAVHLLVMTARPEPVKNLKNCIARCHLGVEHVCSSALASSMAVLNADERRLGAVTIDLGGGTASVVVWRRGNPVFTACVPAGGMHVTNDIAQGLKTPIHEAERIKVLFGSAISATLDEEELIEVPQMGEHRGADSREFPRSMLVNIISPRIMETLDYVRGQLDKAGLLPFGRYLVLTGGASQLPGVRELARQIFEKPVEIRSPEGYDGVKGSSHDPSLATAIGLLHYARAQELAPQQAALDFEPPNSLFGRISRWIREYL